MMSSLSAGLYPRRSASEGYSAAFKPAAASSAGAEKTTSLAATILADCTPDASNGDDRVQPDLDHIIKLPGELRLPSLG